MIKLLGNHVQYILLLLVKKKRYTYDQRQHDQLEKQLQEKTKSHCNRLF